MSWEDNLASAFSDALSKTVGVVSEEEALEEALQIADGWAMRLGDIEEEACGTYEEEE